MRNWLQSATGLKVISLVLAIFTWFFVKAVTSDSRLVEGVPLEIRVRPGMVVASSSAQTVNVTVRGTTEDLRQASRNELYAVLDLTHVDKPDSVAMSITPKSVRAPRRVQVTSVEPSDVLVRVARANE
ncbi:MAG TPA: CdaR family protein [Verrucomicrobiae bacterium]|nr:CdaR family protein [Verrucomicrobiae bacterium]